MTCQIRHSSCTALRRRPRDSSRTLRLRRQAFTLAEVLLVLVVATAITVVGLRIYALTAENARINQTTTDLTEIHGAVQSLYEFRHDYSDISAEAVAKALPLSMSSGGNLVLYDAFDGQFLLAAARIAIAGDSYTVVATNLDQSACLRVATIDLGRSLYDVSIDSGDGAAFIPSDTPGSAPATPAYAAARCKGGLNSVGFQLR